jgi:hypothetical protein
LAVTLVAFTVAGAQVMSFSAAVAADKETFSGAAERRVVPRPPTAASDGLPVPALVGGVVLAFAVGIAGGQVHRRRRTAHRRSVAGARPSPVPTPPARPAPEPPATETRPEPRPVDLAPAAPAAPAPAPPEAEVPAEQPVDLAGPSRPLPAPPPPEPEATPARVLEPPAAPAPAAPEPPRRDEPQRERPREPLRLVARSAQRPALDAPLGEAPEVPRLEQPPAAESAIPLESAPESVLTSADDVPAPAPAPAPARRFARPAPWPEDVAELWTCEIAWKAGYRKSSFRAMAGPPGADKRRPFGDSPSVRWSLMSEPEPPTPELAIRVRALVQALEAAGWEHIGRGRDWYAQRFVWRGSGEPQPVDIPDVEPAER